MFSLLFFSIPWKLGREYSDLQESIPLINDDFAVEARAHIACSMCGPSPGSPLQVPQHFRAAFKLRRARRDRRAKMKRRGKPKTVEVLPVYPLQVREYASQPIVKLCIRTVNDLSTHSSSDRMQKEALTRHQRPICLSFVKVTKRSISRLGL